MPYEIPPSPVAPLSGSRLWTAGAGSVVAVAVLLGLAALHRDIAGPLLGGAALVALLSHAPVRSDMEAQRPDAAGAP
jgi:two-component system phosphate regulon sensor histidine kinase PhoR